MREQDDLFTKIAHLSRKVENLEVRKVNEVVSVPQEEPCSLCELVEHSVKDSPILPVYKEVLHE